MPSNKRDNLGDNLISQEANPYSGDEGFDQLPLVIILGPTAVGKTELAIHLASQFKGEIISADSTLIYRGMDIGTAKPTAEQRTQVPHHLIDVTDPDKPWSLTLYQRAANEAIKDIHSRNSLPFLVGGTGQYIRAIVEVWRIPKVKPDWQMRQVLEKWTNEIGRDGLHTRLTAIDPIAASKIEPQNLRRTIRALEVIFHSGQRFSDQRLHGKSPHYAIQIGINLPRPVLYARIDSRIDGMLDAGLVSEVKNLLSKYSPDLPAFSAIGYREISDYLLGEITLEQALTIIKKRTRQFVRRQANWFKEDDPHIHWFQLGNDSYSEIESLLRCKLGYD
jgi:tRNA dimethylallyltransferase